MKARETDRVTMGSGVVLGTGLLLLLPWPDAAVPPPPLATGGACVAVPDTGAAAATSPSAFYAIDLVPTGKVPGTGTSDARATVTFVDSPFDVALADDGTFHRRVRVDLSSVGPPPSGGYVVWAAPPDLDRIVKLGSLGEKGGLISEVSFPKFLLVVSLEDDPDGVTGRWSGPIAFRGMSRSGFMHSMAGHGPFQGEPCANYGFSQMTVAP